MIRTISETQRFGITLTSGADNSTASGVYIAGQLSDGLIGSTLYGSYASGVTLSLNPETIASSATIASDDDNVTAVYGPTGTLWTLTNYGQISESGNSTYGVSFAGGGTITNAASGTIYGSAYDIKVVGGPAAVTNLGLLAYASRNIGVGVSDGGSVTNGADGPGASTALIWGYFFGVRFLSVGGDTVTNFGTILGPQGKAVSLVTGSVINGSTLATAALISGIVGVRISGAGGTVTNYGTIRSGDNGSGSPAGEYTGVYLLGAGTISNLGTASLIEGYHGLVGLGGDTVINAGTIASNVGAGGNAVYFSAGVNRLIVDPGAVFIGTIDGGTTATTTIELAAGAGTLQGFGASIVNVASLIFDAGSYWTVSGNDAANGLGTLGIGGFTFGDTIDLTGFIAVSRTFSSNTLVLTNGGGAHETLAIQGAFSTGDFHIAPDGTGGTDINEQPDLAYGQTIDATGIVATSETVTAGVLTLLSAGSPVGTINVGTSLSTGDFVLASDGVGGTDVIVSTIFGTYGAGVTLLVPVTTISATGVVNYSGSDGSVAISGPGGSTWNLTNNGTVADTGPDTYGVSFAGGGTVTNTATISGGGEGVYIGNGGGTGLVVNQGSIAGVSEFGVYLVSGGQVTNTAGATISGRQDAVRVRNTGAVVSNLGGIAGGTNSSNNYGVYLRDGGLVINGQSGTTASTASIVGYYGLVFKASGTATGTLINFGTVLGEGGSDGAGVKLTHAGTITNGPSGATAALIQGSRFGVTAAQAIVVNYATIDETGTSPGYDGIYIHTAGTVSNLGTASVIEGYLGVLLQTDGTLTNAGTIEANQGSVGIAVEFSGGNARLIADPGAVFIGSIFGGSGTTVMELGSAATAGTLSGFGTTITNFTSLTFDPGARWTVTGNDSASGLGTLGIGGFTFGDTIDLTGFVAVSKTFASNALVLTDGGGAHETLAIQGAFSTGDFQISSDGAGGTDINEQAVLAYGQTIDATGIVATSETVAAGVLTLLAAGSPVGTINVGTSLSTGDFVLASDGSGGTDVIVSTVFGTYGAGVTLLVPITTISATGTVDVTGPGGGTAIKGPNGTRWNLTNNGTIVDTGSNAYGVSFAGGGTVTNTATISGVGEGVYIGNGGGTGLVVNQGSITGTNQFGIYLVSGGQVTNTAGATISGGGDGVRVRDTGAVVGNLGVIAAGTRGSNDYGVYLRDGGLVTNGQSGTTTSTALIVGYNGLALKSGDVGNATGTLINFGTVLGEGSGGAGVFLSNSGTVTNGPSGATAALIQGSRFGVTAAQAIVVNYATIDETGANPGYDGIYIQTAGTVSNLGTASVIEGYFGVQLATDGTLTNAGTIESNVGGVVGVAVDFLGGNARLIADPGAVFIGGIVGGNGGTTVMELAPGDNAGTLSGFGTTITNFTSLTFDAGARWTVTGNDSANGLGTLGISGFTFGDTIDLTGFVAVSRTFASNSLVLTDGGGAHATLAIQGAFSTGQFQISSDGAGGTEINEQPNLAYGQTIDATGIVASSETVAAGVLTLLSAGSPVGTINVGTSLSTGDFTLRSDGVGGTDVIVSTLFGTYGQRVTLTVPVTTISSTGRVSFTGSTGTASIYGPIGTAWDLTNNGTVVAGGTQGYGVALYAGGTVTNTASISGGIGVLISGGTGVVVNQGSIGGRQGVYLVAAGQVTNAAGATIDARYDGVRMSGTAATVSNLGQIAATVITDGAFGVYLRDGGLVTNGQSGTGASTASIQGYYGLRFGIASVPTATGTLINFGTVMGEGADAAGVSLANSGTVTNGPSGATAALIEGGQYGVSAAHGVVINYATIEATGTNVGSDGIAIQTAGTVSNLGTASVIEGYFGVQLGNDGTLTNAGTIESNQGGVVGVAVDFVAGNSRLIADPGAVFIGGIAGGAGGTTVMELGSAATAGTLSGFGTTITNFTSLTFDPGARWTVTGDDLARGLGTLGIGGFTFGDTIDLTGFVAVSRTFASNSLVLTDGGGAHETLAIQGAFSTGQFQISSDGTGGTDINEQADLAYGQTIDATGIVASSETVATGVLTLLAAGSPVGTINVGTSLSTGDFTLKSDGSGGTDVIVSTVFGTYGAAVTLVVPVTTISATGTVSFAGTSGSGAIIGPTGTAWNLTNNGTVANTASTGYGVQFEAGGTVTNAASISGGAVGVYISGAAGLVVNQGSISGSHGIGVYLFPAGQVTNAAGATISGDYIGVKQHGTAATVSNLGQIVATSITPSGYGVYLRDGGLITNGQGGAGTSTASIQGYYGITFKTADVVNALGTLINFGTVFGEGTAGIAVELNNGGTVTNGPSGATAALIHGGRYGVVAAQGQVVNFGTIEETGVSSGDVGVSIGHAGILSNLGTASLIEGYYGVLLQVDGTLTNAGTIASNLGSLGIAVQFNGGDARLIADPGAVFIGSIYGGVGGTAVMELASAASAGTLSGFGTTITNFTSVVFDSGAQWTIGGNDSTTGLGTLGITGFTAGDTIDLTGFVAVTDTFASNVLVLTNGGGAHATLHVDGVFTSGDFHLSGDGGSGTDIIVCYAKGTHIATPTGEQPIEDLAPGDLVSSYFGGPVPVRWVGRRHVDCTRHPDPQGAWPVRVAAGAFGPAGPHRDLFLSPNHAVCVLGDLIPVKYLINGTLIAQVPVDEVTYYHVELAEHDMLWAEGLQAESYLDVGDRANFANAGGAVLLFPDFAADNAMLWEARGCAPLIVHGVRLEAARNWVNGFAGCVVSAEVMAA